MSGKKNEGVLYKEIEASLRRRILSGQWPVGTMLPSRRELAREHGVSSLTVERAITPLISAGLLHADNRRGTFVADFTRAQQPLPAAIPPPATPQRAAPPATVAIVGSLYVHREPHLELNNFWVDILTRAIEQSVCDARQSVRFVNRAREAGGPILPLSETIALALAEKPDAIAVIAFEMNPRDVDTALTPLEEHERAIPAVCLASGRLHRPIPHVFADNFSAGYRAAECLMDIGREKIVYFAPFTASWAEERWEGIRAAVQRRHGSLESLSRFPEQPEAWRQEQDPQLPGYRFAEKLFDSPLDPPPGIVCVNDGVAFGLLHAASEHGYALGRNFDAIGFDDHPQARERDLSSMRQPMEAMGREASALLLRVLRGEAVATSSAVPWTLIQRAPGRNS